MFLLVKPGINLSPRCEKFISPPPPPFSATALISSSGNRFIAATQLSAQKHGRQSTVSQQKDIFVRIFSPKL